MYFYAIVNYGTYFLVIVLKHDAKYNGQTEVFLTGRYAKLTVNFVQAENYFWYVFSTFSYMEKQAESKLFGDINSKLHCLGEKLRWKFLTWSLFSMYVYTDTHTRHIFVHTWELFLLG